MKGKKAAWTILGLLLGFSGGVRAQYYDLGQSPASIRWQQVRTPYNRFIFPENFQGHASRLMKYLDTIRPAINYGFTYGPLKLPVVMHTQNFQSNGLVMWAPKRMELIVTPEQNIFAEPWLKQLATHEYRHAVQYNNLNRNFIRVLSWLIGQQGSLVGVALMPIWLLEGDAVMAETQMSTFGRGLQPSFTIDYRALAGEKQDFLRSGGVGKGPRGADLEKAVAEGLPANRWDRYAVDKWFCGSYKDYVPDHYHVGYQIATYAYTRYKENIWNEVARYGSSHPYFILTTKIALHRKYRTSANKLFRATFSDLDRFWDSVPAQRSSSRIIPTPTTSFTTYSGLMPTSDSTVLALKVDLDHPSRFVDVNLNTGAERVVRYTGSICSQPTPGDSLIYWSEYRPSTLWDQRVNAQLCWMDPKTGKSGIVRGERRTLYPTPIPENGVARVEYEYPGYYTIVDRDRRFTLPDTVSVHGLTWDDTTQQLYFIGLSDAGMWIGALDGNSPPKEANGFLSAGNTPSFSIRIVKQPSRSTLANLRAGEGKLWFNSIQSGFDEAHCFDPASGEEYRVTTSRYGSFSPAPLPGGKEAVVTTYTPRGYLLARQTLDPDSLVAVTNPGPQDVINPPRIKWEVPNIDSVKVDTTITVQPKRFRKGLNLLNVHSWAPVAFDPDGVMGEKSLNIHAGVSIMSQSLLNDMFAYLNYAWTDQGSMGTGRIRYYGWAPKIELEASYGGGRQLLYKPTIITSKPDDPDTTPGNPQTPDTSPAIPEDQIGIPHSSLKPYFETSLRVFMPILLDAGYHIRYLTPQVEVSHNNALLYDPENRGFDKGMQKLSVSLQYLDNVRMAHRDFLPKWGYAVRFSSVCNPFNKHFGKLWSLYLRGYLPGVAPHHSLMLRAAGQYQHAGMYNYRQKEVYPRGAYYDISPRRYLGTAVDYQLPLACPDWGITSILYIKRIRLNLAGDFARYQEYSGKYGNVHSYGGELIFDVNPVRTPAPATTTFSISVFKPSDHRGVVVGANVGISL